MKNTKKRTIIRYLPVYGSIATGMIYFGIGLIAILSFLKVRHGGADESSMLAILDDYIVGKILIWVILLGTVCYIAWRFYEAITDPYGYGREAKGVTRRIGIALSSVADILIVYAAILILLGAGHVQTNGQPDQEQEMVRNILKQTHGKWLVVGIGCVYVVTAVIQLLYGITKGYRERVNLERFSSFFQKTIQFLAWTGYSGRGIILGITGFFFVKAGLSENARHVVNTDKAFDFIGDHLGHLYFVLVAGATVCYGFFMFAQGIAYDPDKD
jgi:hypothetical protein